MKRGKKRFLRALGVFFALGVFTTSASAAKGLVLEGVVTSEVSEKPIEFAVVAVLEIKKKVRTDENGRYRVVLPKKGKYTFYVSSEGLKTVKLEIDVGSNMTQDFVLSTSRITGRGLTIHGQREEQSLSRYSMSAQEVKDVPAGFGDIVKSLTSMPGIISRGMFGSLIMRGADTDGNSYRIDDIPILSPQHFFGLHSVISTDAVREVDVYSSAFPAQFGSAHGALISINTIDTVEKPETVANLSIISFNALSKGPLMKIEGDKEVNTGYWMVGGRIGYVSALFPLFNDILKLPVIQLPDYSDYQFKLHYYFDSAHSLRLLLIGSDDIWKYNPDPAAEAFLLKQSAGDDPLNPMKGGAIQFSQGGHAQGLYYDWKPSDQFLNTLMFYSSLNYQNYYMELIYANSTADFSRRTTPNIFGLKNKSKLKWINDETFLLLGLEYTYFDFSTKGKDFVRIASGTPGGVGGGPPDFTDPTQYDLITYEKRAANQTYEGYLENRFRFGGFTFHPGVRLSYLDLSGEFNVDPRGLISYEFESDTLVSFAAGRYSNFMQSNLNYFDSHPTVALIPDYVSEKSDQYAFGVEQGLDGFSLKAEVFYSSFEDISYSFGPPTNLSAAGERMTRINSGLGRNYGFELMLRKKPDPEITEGLFGWVNYAYTQAKEMTRVPDQPHRNNWINSSSEEEHAVKMVAGYRWPNHTLSGRVAFMTSFPYTKIVGDDNDPYVMGRYAPVYAGIPNTERFDPNITLDLRYTHTKTEEWGTVSFYIEAINVLGVFYSPKSSQKWRYDIPYQKGVNPVLGASDFAVPIIPNFGVEVKF